MTAHFQGRRYRRYVTAGLIDLALSPEARALASCKRHIGPKYESIKRENPGQTKNFWTPVNTAHKLLKDITIYSLPTGGMLLVCNSPATVSRQRGGADQAAREYGRYAAPTFSAVVGRSAK